MMAVGDIEKWNLGKLLRDESDSFRVTDRPSRVTHAVLRGEVHFRFAGGFFRHEFIHLRRRAVGEEHWSSLRVERFNVPHTVVLLVGTRELVLLDDAAQILLAARRGNEADLRVMAHDLTVEVKARLRVLLERALRNEPGEILLPDRKSTRL